ncbi:sugar ABC transporter permease [Romboutsia weinsteinii]|uniref:Sugar ABC transporter permease n=1 Tax=Romboutsia weinsteinii TaxID=2020949 RepID=A0A371J409_9FIRM|nr:sugar ABC transporter permease [Romboutsia weinsteinii]RDY27475.1 sugar ABC transporter permease [Romboutsia weinsteinii]
MKKHYKAYLYIAPALIGIILFVVYPILYNIYLSFQSGSLINLSFDFVGLENYQNLLGDSDFIVTIKNTAIYTIAMVGISISLSLLCAVWLNKKTFIHNLAQTIMFTPHIVSLVSIGVLFMWILNPDYGILNWVLENIGLPTSKWLSSEKTALFSIISVGIWKTVGYNTLVFVAGLQSIPKHIYEAADLDNSSKITTFFKITLPMLSPTIFFLLITTTTASFQVFDLINVMTKGGPINSTNMLVYHIYESGFRYYNIGEASAASVFLIIIVGILTLAHFKLLSNKVHYQ